MKDERIDRLENIEEYLEITIDYLETPTKDDFRVGVIVGLRAAYSRIIQEINELEVTYTNNKNSGG